MGEDSTTEVHPLFCRLTFLRPEALNAARQLNKEQYYDLATVRIISCYFYAKDRAALTKEIDSFMAAGPATNVPAEILGWLGIEYYNEKPIGVLLPDTVDLLVKETEMTIQKATASAVTKPATLETGLVINVPPFVNAGDKVKVDTSEGRYIQRVQ